MGLIVQDLKNGSNHAQAGRQAGRQAGLNFPRLLPRENGKPAMGDNPSAGFFVSPVPIKAVI